MIKDKERFTRDTCPSCGKWSDMLLFGVKEETPKDHMLSYRIITKYRCLDCMVVLDRELHRSD